MWSGLDETGGLSPAPEQSVLQPRGIAIESVSRKVEDANRVLLGTCAGFQQHRLLCPAPCLNHVV